MNCNGDIKLRWQDGVKDNHHVEIDLDLTVDDFLTGKNIPFALIRREREIRRELFHQILNGPLLKAVNETGIPWNIAWEWNADINGNHTYNWTITDPKVAGESVALRSAMKLVFDIKVNRPVNAIQAVRAANHNITTAIVDNVLCALKDHYLGITSSDTITHTAPGNGVGTELHVINEGNHPSRN